MAQMYTMLNLKLGMGALPCPLASRLITTTTFGLPIVLYEGYQFAYFYLHLTWIEVSIVWRWYNKMTVGIMYNICDINEACLIKTGMRWKRGFWRISGSQSLFNVGLFSIDGRFRWLPEMRIVFATLTLYQYKPKEAIF